MKKITNPQIVVILIALGLLVVLFGNDLFLDIFQSDTNHVIGMNCNYNTSYCNETYMEGSSERLEKYWQMTNDLESWDNYKMRNPIEKEFFYHDFDLYSIRNKEVPDGKGGVNYWTNMYPEHCLSPQNHYMEILERQIIGSYGYSGYGVDRFSSVTLGCNAIEDYISVFKDLSLSYTTPNAPCPTYNYKFDMIEELSNCKYINGVGSFHCYEYNHQSACPPVNIPYTQKSYDYTPEYNEFEAISLLENPVTSKMFQNYTSFRFTTPVFYIDHGWYSDYPWGDNYFRWIYDKFNGKYCSVEVSTNNGTLKLYGKTQLTFSNGNQPDRLQCAIVNYASLDGIAISNETAERLTRSGELEFSQSQVKIDWDFSKTDFPILSECNNNNEKVISGVIFNCVDGQWTTQAEDRTIALVITISSLAGILYFLGYTRLFGFL